MPKIPKELSEEGKDFLEKCFVKDPKKRWSAEMLLKHPFIANDNLSVMEANEKSTAMSPTTHFDFPSWGSTVTVTASCSPVFDDWRGRENAHSNSPADRLRRLATDERPVNWLESDDWMSVRI
ncbi:hypothetical protein RJT34_05749 [Clitoria ternatea]|uniref:Protein kinase domain-containing protein n=1 Tax=Clitoria ternatea TaxID=43366 RepID=A0AAN9K309_CLITE